MKQIFHQLFIAEWGTVNVCLRAIFGKSREDAKKYVEEVVKAKK